MALLTVATIGRAGVDVVGAAATAVTGDTLPNTGVEFVEIKNGSGAPINVTIDYVATADGNAVVDPVVAVGAGVTKAMGPFAPNLYNDASGRVKFTCDSVTSVTIKALKLGST
jgi:hypothetical protein